MDPTQWQPIESAPRDHQTHVLLFHPRYGTMHVGHWDGGLAGQFEITDEGFEYLADFYPTHWMPLPQPPRD